MLWRPEDNERSHRCGASVFSDISWSFLPRRCSRRTLQLVYLWVFAVSYQNPPDLPLTVSVQLHTIQRLRRGSWYPWAATGLGLQTFDLSTGTWSFLLPWDLAREQVTSVLYERQGTKEPEYLRQGTRNPLGRVDVARRLEMRGTKGHKVVVPPHEQWCIYSILQKMGSDAEELDGRVGLRNHCLCRNSTRGVVVKGGLGVQADTGDAKTGGWWQWLTPEESMHYTEMHKGPRLLWQCAVEIRSERARGRWWALAQ